MESTLKCGYCRIYFKGKSFKDGDSVLRECPITPKRVGFNHPTCEYFSPKETFYCEKYGDRVQIPICLHRRFNKDNFMHYLYCKKCRQFSRDIKEITSLYFLDAKKIKKVKEENEVELPKKRKLKRRTEQPKKRIIKRREVKPEKRKLKRRKRNGE